MNRFVIAKCILKNIIVFRKNVHGSIFQFSVRGRVNFYIIVEYFEQFLGAAHYQHKLKCPFCVFFQDFGAEMKKKDTKFSSDLRSIHSSLK